MTCTLAHVSHFINSLKHCHLTNQPTKIYERNFKRNDKQTTFLISHKPLFIHVSYFNLIYLMQQSQIMRSVEQLKMMYENHFAFSNTNTSKVNVITLLVCIIIRVNYILPSQLYVL